MTPGSATGITDGRAAFSRKRADYVSRVIAKATGAEDRKAAAQAKRERKSRKRRLDNMTSIAGQVIRVVAP